jgi:hypothetical protein
MSGGGVYCLWSKRLHLSTLGNDYVHERLLGVVGFGVVDHVNDVHSFDDLTKNDVLVVEARVSLNRDKELAAIGIQSSEVGHAESSGPIMSKHEILVFEMLRLIDSSRSRAIAFDEVPTLEHKPFDLP